MEKKGHSKNVAPDDWLYFIGMLNEPNGQLMSAMMVFKWQI